MSTSALGTPAYFHKRYLGPKGPHLQHRTYFTQTGTPAKEDTQSSIHPRVFRGVTVGPKLNTSLPVRTQRGSNPYAVPMTKFRAKGK
jgi:hypothetical protein